MLATKCIKLKSEMNIRLSCSGMLFPVALLFPHLWQATGTDEPNLNESQQKPKKLLHANAVPKLPLVINTWAFCEANKAAWSELHQSKNPINALVEGCTMCERLQCDGTVGYGGSPDENGETTLDAMIMDGATMNIGAVAALREVKDAIKVARYVLEHTRHTLLVGDQATDFAKMMGFQRESLSTKQSHQIWMEWREKDCQPNFWNNVMPDPKTSCGPYKPIESNSDGAVSSNYYDYVFVNEKKERADLKFGEKNHDTIGMIVMDLNGHMVAGTSTNGAKYKIPGRVGDSPIPGAGAYADNDVGAAVATGDGDVMMRFLPSLLAVEAMRTGHTPEEATEGAMRRIVRFYPDFSGGLIAVNKSGNYSAACVGMDRFPFSIVSGEEGQLTRVEYKECIKENLDAESRKGNQKV